MYIGLYEFFPCVNGTAYAPGACRDFYEEHVNICGADVINPLYIILGNHGGGPWADDGTGK